jgi:Leucine-rich repeat (LRR) protein
MSSAVFRIIEKTVGTHGPVTIAFQAASSNCVPSPKVSDAAVEQLKGLANLENLTLSGNKLTDKGLAELKGLTKLKFLEVSRTQVTPQGIEALKKALPMLQISKSP